MGDTWKRALALFLQLACYCCRELQQTIDIETHLLNINDFLSGMVRPAGEVDRDGNTTTPVST